jgi:hypothetical protein
MQENNPPSGELFDGELMPSQVKVPAPQAIPPLSSVTTKTPNPSPFSTDDIMSLVSLNETTESGGELAPPKTEGEAIAAVEASATQLPLYKKPSFKTLLIGGGISVIVAGLGQVVFGGSGTPSQPAVTTATEPKTEVSKADFKPDPNFGVVVAKLAMSEQRKTIEAAAKQQQDALAKENAATITTGTAAPKTDLPPANGQPQMVTNTQPEPEVPYQAPAPQPASVSAPIAANPQPVAKPADRIEAPKPVAKTETRTPVLVKTEIPKLAAKNAPNTTPPLGAVGQVAKPVKPKYSWETASQNGIYGWSNREGAAANDKGQAGTSNTVAISRSDSTRGKIIAGQQVAAQMLTPIQILEGQNHQPIILRLSQAIIDTDGRVAIGAGTQIMAEAIVHGNGMVEIGTAVANGQELPAGTFTIQGTNREPLLAQVKRFGEGEVLQRDLLSFIGGALQGIGDEVTQPQTQTVLGVGGIIQNSNPQNNIAGAILKGGFTPVNQQWLARNQQAIAKINSKSSIWFLPTTTRINLIVMKQF